jgi:hypothetical protein
MTTTKPLEAQQQPAPDADPAPDTAPAATGEQPQTDPATPEAPATDAPAGDQAPAQDDPKSFDAEYVGKLREESAGYRTRLRDREQAMHRMMVEKSGRLADPADLTFDVAHLDDPDVLAAAIDALLEAKPHLKARAFEAGGAAQGTRGPASSEVNLAELMRGMI